MNNLSGKVLTHQSCFYVPKGKMQLTVEAISNLVLAGALLSKAINDADYMPLLLRFEQNATVEALKPLFCNDIQSSSQFTSEVLFLNEYRFEAESFEHQPSQYRNESMIFYMLKSLRDSQKTQENMISFLKTIMPFLSRMKDFINHSQQNEQNSYLKRQQLFQAVCSEKDLNVAYKKYQKLIELLERAKLEDIPQQLLLGKAMIGLADCLEIRGEYQRAIGYYFSAQSIFGKLLHEEAATTHFWECDKKAQKLLDLLQGEECNNLTMK